MLKKLFLLSSIFLLSSSTTCANPNGRTLVFYVVSDTNNNVSGPDMLTGGKAVVTTGNGGWTASVPGASWIWDIAQVSIPSVNQQSFFINEFYIPGIPISGILLAAGDNTVITTVNNAPIICAISNTWNKAVSCDVSIYLLPGMNVIGFAVTNSGSAGAVPGPGVNPAGIIYKLTITASVI